MKLKYTFESVDMGDEVILVPIGDDANNIHGVLKLNNSGLEIVELLKNEISEERIEEILAAKYGNSKEELSKFVRATIEALQAADLLA